MKLTTLTFVARLSFLFEKHNKMYIQYIVVSFENEKDNITRKDLQGNQLQWVRGRVGVLV